METTLIARMCRILKNNHESGEVMLEGMIIMCLTMFLLVWILGVGFIYYQRNVITTISNDAAVKIADTYCYPSSDLIIGYVEPENFTNRDLYRGIMGDSLLEKNTEKAKKYIQYRLQKTNFSNVVDSVEVELEMINDSALRKHIEVTAKCTFNTPFGVALKFFGMSDKFTYQAVGRADCTDVIDYISTVDYRDNFDKNLNSNFVKAIDSCTKLIYKLIDKYNHNYD